MEQRPLDIIIQAPTFDEINMVMYPVTKAPTMAMVFEEEDDYGFEDDYGDLDTESLPKIIPQA